MASGQLDASSLQVEGLCNYESLREPTNLLGDSCLPVTSVRQILNLMGNSEEISEAVHDRIMFDPKLLTTLGDFKLRDLKYASILNDSKPVYKCVHITKASDVERLQAAYPMFNVVGSASAETVQHPYARESRMLDHRYIYDKVLRYSNDISLTSNYDVYVKDIGGMPIIHDSQCRSKVHVCMPRLSAKDVFRVANWTDYVQRNGIDSKVDPLRHPIVNDYISPNPRLVCHCLGQYCRVKAPWLTFIHSTYDMTIHDIGSCFDIADATSGYAVFLYTEDIRHKEHGRLEDYGLTWDVFWLNGVKMISFAFDTDAGCTYIHVYDTYVALMCKDRFRTPGGKLIMIDREYVNCTIHMRFVVLSAPVSFRETIGTRIPFPDAKDDIFFATYRYSTIGIGDHMTPVVFKLKKSFFHAVCFYGLGLTDTKFTYDNLRKYIVSANSKLVVGMVTHDGPNLSPSEITVLAVGMYMYIYILNFESSKALQAMISDEQKLRMVEWYWGPLRFWLRAYYKFFGNGFRKAHPLLPADGIYSDADNLVDNLSQEFQKSKESISPRKTVVEMVERYFPEFKRKYPLAVCGPRTYFSVSQIEPEYLHADAPRYTHVHPISADAFLHSSTVKKISELKQFFENDAYLKETLNYARSRSAATATGIPFINTLKTVCSCTTVQLATSVPGDGDCFFHCIRSALSLQETNSQLRKRLRSSPYLESLCVTVNDDSMELDHDVRQELLHRLEPVSDPSDMSRWADDLTVALTALTLKISICVHTEKGAYVFNSRAYNGSANFGKLTSGTSVHLALRNNHFSLLAEDVSSVMSHLHYDLDDSGEKILLDESWYGDSRCFDPVVVAPLNGRDELVAEDRRKIVKEYRTYATRANPFAQMNTYGYASFYGPMLHTAFESMIFENAHPLKILDVDPRNGSSLQYLCDVDINGHPGIVTSLTVAGGRRKPIEPPFRAVESERTLWKFTERDFSRVLSSVDLYDIVVINPAYFSDEIGLVNGTMHIEHLRKLMPASNYISKGGKLVVPILMPLDSPTLDIVQNLQKSFALVKIVCPLVQPAYLNWVFVVCEGYQRPVNITVKHSDCPIATLSVISSVSDNSAQAIDQECNRIVDKKYSMPSSEFMKTLRTFVPERKVASISGGYMPILLPSFSPVIAEGFPIFTKEFLMENYSGNLFSAIKGDHFQSRLTKYSILVTDHVLKVLKLDRSPSLLLRVDKLLADDCESDLMKKYLVALHIALRSGLNYVKLDMAYVDVGKPLKSTAFYSGRIKTSITVFSQEIREYINDKRSGRTEKSKTLQSMSQECVVRPVNPEIFPDETKLVRFSGKLSFDNMFHDSVEDSSGDYLSCIDDRPSGYIDPEKEKPDDKDKVFWADDCYNTDYKSAASIYLGEFHVMTKTTVDTTIKDIKSTVGFVADAFRTSSCAASRKQNIVPHIGRDYIDGCVLQIDNKLIYGKLDEVIGRRYLMAFDYSSHGVKNVRLISEVKKITSLPASFISVKALEIFMEKDILRELESFEHNSTVPDISIVQAGPGCGKTREIVEILSDNFDSDMIGVFKNRENVVSVKADLKKALERKSRPMGSNMMKYIDKSVVSIDNVLSDVKSSMSKNYTRLLVDEGMTHHPGKIVFLSLVIGAPTTVYGDVMQIGFICRVNDFCSQYSDTCKAFPITRFMNKSFRCPQDVCFFLSSFYSSIAKALGQVYDDPRCVFMSSKPLKPGEVPYTVRTQMIQDENGVIVSENLQILTFTQAEKLQLQSKYGRRLSKPVFTVHEYQGNQSENVALVRTNRRDDVSSSPNPGGIYNSVPHIISAISRHTVSMVYYTVTPNDKLSTMIEKLRLEFPRWHAEFTSSMHTS